MAGRKSRNKGIRFERELTRKLRAAGLDAYRVALSGAWARAKGDVRIKVGTLELKCEAKVRSNGFATLYRWLKEADLLVVKADRKPALAVLPLDFLLEILAEGTDGMDQTDDSQAGETARE